MMHFKCPPMDIYRRIRITVIRKRGRNNYFIYI